MLVTTCPQCQTTFRVTEEILAQASGQVRCGRCAHIFGGRATLREHEDTETRHVSTLLQREPAGEDEASAGEPAIGTGIGAADADADGDGDGNGDGDDAESGTGRGDDEPRYSGSEIGDNAPLPGEPSVGAGSGITRSWIIWDPPAGDAAYADSDEDGAGAFPGSERYPRDDADAGADVARDVEPGSAAIEFAGYDAGLEETAEHRMPVFEPEPSRRTSLWATGSVLLVLLLALQAIHHFRATLAELPGIGPAVVGTYDMLGITIAPIVDFDQYTTLDLTAVAEPTGGERGWLVIETRIHNRGPRVQPYPHIFLTLIDRWQETIAGRYFAPEEYIVTTTSDYSSMNAGRTVDAQFIIADPGPDATGFELEFCTPAGERFVCESDVESE